MNSPEAPERPSPIRDDVRLAARTLEHDRYLAALLAPRTIRDDLMVLAAFGGELSRIPSAVHEPMMGEIRLQWWRDALAEDPVQNTGHPVADAVRALAVRRGLSREALEDIVDAQSARLHHPPTDAQHLMADFDRTEGRLFALALRTLGCADDIAMPLAASAGRAYGLARLLIALPTHGAAGKVLLPGQLEAHHLRDFAAEARGYLADARRRARHLRGAQHVAVLPIAVVEPYLQAFEKPGRDPLRDPIVIAPLRRVWRLLFAHWSGRY